MCICLERVLYAETARVVSEVHTISLVNPFLRIALRTMARYGIGIRDDIIVAAIAKVSFW